MEMAPLPVACCQITKRVDLRSKARSSPTTATTIVHFKRPSLPFVSLSPSSHSLPQELEKDYLLIHHHSKRLGATRTLRHHSAVDERNT